MTKPDTQHEPVNINDVDSTRKASKLIIFIAIILTFIGVFLGFVGGLSRGIGKDGRTGELVGHSLGVIIMALICVVLFQLLKRFRNQRSRWKIYCWSIAVISLSTVVTTIQAVVPLATGQALENFTLSGYYCNETELGSIETCICYNFKDAGILGWSYGRVFSDSTYSDTHQGTYKQNKNEIETSLINSEGELNTETMSLVLLDRISASDGLVLRKTSGQPALCAGDRDT